MDFVFTDITFMCYCICITVVLSVVMITMSFDRYVKHKYPLDKVCNEDVYKRLSERISAQETQLDKLYDYVKGD